MTPDLIALLGQECKCKISECWTANKNAKNIFNWAENMKAAVWLCPRCHALRNHAQDILAALKERDTLKTNDSKGAPMTPQLKAFIKQAMEAFTILDNARERIADCPHCFDVLTQKAKTQEYQMETEERRAKKLKQL